MSDTFVIVGGDAAGMSAASKAKREDPDTDVVVFEKGEWVSYAACGMPWRTRHRSVQSGIRFSRRRRFSRGS